MASENQAAKNKIPTKGARVIQYYTDEWNNRFAILDDGRIFRSRNRGVAGANYEKWVEWDLASEIKRDIGEK